MNSSSIQYFLVIVLLTSAWTLKYRALAYPYTDIRPTTEKEYPPCDEFFKSRPDLSESKFMVTEIGSLHNFYNISESHLPVAKDYSKCVWCQQNYSVKCVQQFCFKRTFYVGPVNETCLLPDTMNFQIIRQSEHKNGITNEPESKVLPSNGFPKILHIPIGGLKKRNAPRERRYLEVCSFPDGLDTASLDCSQYPSYVKCTQMCAFGYTLQGGIQQEMKCLKKENMWRPVGFIECQPFVDCTATLSSGGNLKCTHMSLKSAPTCTVSCSHYEDKDEVPTNTYTCNIQGKWDPPLPFCAHPGQGLMLTSAPKKKLHD